MSIAIPTVPLTETFAPQDQAELAELVARAYREGVYLYALGGGTSAAVGVSARKKGWGISLRNLQRVVDYAARDMTITVEAGITMGQLASVLAREGQRLPIDVPRAAEATLGGAIAKGCGGVRRYGYGTMRDYVIGISAVDGRGVAFKGGGRVVKNVAGYDICRLLTGSLGTLGIITQATLKLRPVAEATALLACDVTSFDEAESILAALVQSRTTPVAIELLAGKYWLENDILGRAAAGTRARIVVGLEGTEAEVAWMTSRLQEEWREQHVERVALFEGPSAVALWNELIEAGSDGAHALTVKAAVRPSSVAQLVDFAVRLAPEIDVQCHAGNGVAMLKFQEFGSHDALRILVSGLQPMATKLGGHAVVTACAADVELTHQAIWGPSGEDVAMMRAVKAQLDPKNLWNAGRSILDS